MKKLLTILFLTFSVAVFGQYPLVQGLGSDSTLIRVGQNYRGGIKGGLINMTVTDTATANTYRISQYPGSQLFTTSDGNLWVRNMSATGWLLMGGGSSPSGNFWRIGGNPFPILPTPAPAIGTLAPWGGGIGLMTSSTINVLLPDGGLVLNHDTAANKVMTYNTSTNEWGYGYWKGGGNPTWQQTLTTGSTLTGNNSVAGGGFNFAYTNMGNFDITFDGTNSDFRLFNAESVYMESIQGSNYGYFELEYDNIDLFVEDGTGRSSRINLGATKSESLVIRPGALTYLRVLSDSIHLMPHLGQLNIDTLRTWSAIADTLYKKPMTWDTRNGRWEYASNWFGGGGGSTAISALTAAAATNDINNANYGQTWRWNSLSTGAALSLLSNTTAATDDYQTILYALLEGANANASQTTYVADFSNTHTGTTSTNIGLRVSASGGTTNIPLDLGAAGSSTGRMRFNGATSGSIILQPADAAGTYTLTLPTTDGNSGEFLQTDGSGVLTWAAAGGGTPGGSDNQVQYNDGGSFGGAAGVEVTNANITFRSQGQAATDVAIVGKAHASQSANIFEIQNSSATSIAHVTSAGRVFATDFYQIIGTDIQQGNVLGTGYNVLGAGAGAGIKFRDNTAAIPFVWEFGFGSGPRSQLVAARQLDYQGTDVASAAGAIALSYGNSFEITGTASITLISNVNWQNGSVVTLIFTSTATLTDGTANSGTDIGMELAGNTNFTASADDVLTLILSEVSGTQRWREVSRSVN